MQPPFQPPRRCFKQLRLRTRTGTHTMRPGIVAGLAGRSLRAKRRTTTLRKARLGSVSFVLAAPIMDPSTRGCLPEYVASWAGNHSWACGGPGGDALDPNNYACGMSYAAQYELQPANYKLALLVTLQQAIAQSPLGAWFWVDTFFMALGTWVRVSYHCAPFTADAAMPLLCHSMGTDASSTTSISGISRSLSTTTRRMAARTPLPCGLPRTTSSSATRWVAVTGCLSSEHLLTAHRYCAHSLCSPTSTRRSPTAPPSSGDAATGGRRRALRRRCSSCRRRTRTRSSLLASSATWPERLRRCR